MAANQPHTDDEDDGEYELEPVDPEILERERRRADERTRDAGAKVAVEKVLQETEPRDPLTLDDFRGFRFSVRHLMIATAIVAVVLSLIEVADCVGMFIVALIALAGGWFFVLRKERRERLERERRLAELGRDEPATAAAIAETSVIPVEPSFRFSFSTRQMFAALTVAAVAFGLIRFLGSPEHAAILLGTIALLGLGIYLIGYDMPPLLILGWWLMLVLYIIVSIWAAFATSLGP